MILDDLAASTRRRVAREKERISQEEMCRKVEHLMEEEYRNPAEKSLGKFPFETAIRKAREKDQIAVISEVKKASPSKGLIAADFPYRKIAQEYEEAGADAISCLTEPEYFQGSNTYLREIAGDVKIPVLRKDFTVDSYMIWEAKALGASAVLLIAAILTDEELKEFFQLADSLGLSCLFEAHNEEEVRRVLAAGARVVGVNNRNLKDFTVDRENSVRLRSLVPEDVLYVSESGIREPADVHRLKKNGTDAVLIGEMLMRSGKKKQLIHELKEV